MQEQNAPQKPMAGVVAKGTAYMVGLRFIVRAMGLVSISITARILTPEDFGVVGTASLVIGFFAILKKVGLGEAIIRLKSADPALIDTIWTIRLLMSFAVTTAIFLSADFAAGFLEEPRVADVLQWLSVTPFLHALNSPASAMFIRGFDFRRESVLKIIQRLVLVVAVVIAAVVLETYWALVIGQLVAAVMSIIVTQIAYPYMPRLTLKHAQSEGRFAFWTFVRDFSNYIANRSDEFVIRKLAPTELFGFYHVTRDLARIFIAETIAPAQTALLPALSKLSATSERFSHAVANTTGVLIILAVPIGLGTMLTAREIVLLALGPQWEGAIPFLSIIAVGAAANAAGEVMKSVFTAAARQHIAANLGIIHAITNVLGCLTAGLLYGPLAVAVVFTILAVLNFLLTLIVLWRSCHIKFPLPMIFLRPVVAGLVMYGAVLALPIDDNTFVAIAAFAKVATGVFVYAGSLWFMWYRAGRPRGAERAIIDLLPSRARNYLL